MCQEAKTALITLCPLGLKSEMSCSEKLIFYSFSTLCLELRRFNKIQRKLQPNRYTMYGKCILYVGMAMVRGGLSSTRPPRLNFEVLLFFN